MEKDELIVQIVELQRQVNRALRQYAPWVNLSLTVAQLRSLFFIASEGSTNSKKLADALKVTPSNVTGIVDRLVEQGLVSRQENPDDRRMSILRATEKGEALVSDLRQTRASHMSEVLARMSLGELSSLARGLTGLVRASSTDVKGRE